MRKPKIRKFIVENLLRWKPEMPEGPLEIRTVYASESQELKAVIDRLNGLDGPVTVVSCGMVKSDFGPHIMHAWLIDGNNKFTLIKGHGLNGLEKGQVIKPGATE